MLRGVGCPEPAVQSLPCLVRDPSVAEQPLPPLDWSSIGIAKQGLNKSKAPQEANAKSNSNSEQDPALVVNEV